MFRINNENITFFSSPSALLNSLTLITALGNVKSVSRNQKKNWILDVISLVHFWTNEQPMLRSRVSNRTNGDTVSMLGLAAPSIPMLAKISSTSAVTSRRKVRQSLEIRRKDHDQDCFPECFHFLKKKEEII